MIDDFAILVSVFVLGLVFGGVIGAVFCTASREEGAAHDATEHGAHPL